MENLLKYDGKIGFLRVKNDPALIAQATIEVLTRNPGYKVTYITTKEQVMIVAYPAWADEEETAAR